MVCTGGIARPNYICVFLGHGDDTFDLPVTTLMSSQEPGHLLYSTINPMRDLNGDGIPDFLYVDETDSTFLVMLGDGTGGSQSPKPLGFTFHDMDGDEHLDAV